MIEKKKDIFSRNILFHNEIISISKKCREEEIKLILLKGAAMVELFPEYSFRREMEDIDVLIEQKNYEKFRKLLYELGYKEVPFDPHAMYNEQKDIQIDIETRVWYLSKKENWFLIHNAKHLSDFGIETDCYVLSPQDMLNYTYIHSYIHHARKENKWEEDVKMIIEKFHLDPLCEQFFSGFNWIMESDIEYKGYILRFLFLSNIEKLVFLLETLFPSVEFMRVRYGIKKGRSILENIVIYIKLIWLYIFRIVKIKMKTIIFLSSFLKTLFSRKFLRQN